MITFLAAFAVAYAYTFALAWRVGHSGRHARILSRPRPLRLMQHGAHAKPRRPRAHPGGDRMPLPTFETVRRNAHAKTALDKAVTR